MMNKKLLGIRSPISGGKGPKITVLQLLTFLLAFQFIQNIRNGIIKLLAVEADITICTSCKRKFVGTYSLFTLTDA